jgi:hypothetical protein
MATTPPTPSEFRIEGVKRVEYNQSVDKPTDADERAMRRAITIWANKQKPGEVQWMYFWTN